MEQLVADNFITATGCHLSRDRRRKPASNIAWRKARMNCQISALMSGEAHWVISYGRTLAYHVLSEAQIRALPLVKRRVMRLCHYAEPRPCEPMQYIS